MLAASVRSATAVPAFDTAALDGYAVAGHGPWTVDGQLLTGRATTPAPLRPGTAVEIATGATVPVGADAVLPYETAEGTARPRSAGSGPGTTSAAPGMTSGPAARSFLPGVG